QDPGLRRPRQGRCGRCRRGACAAAGRKGEAARRRCEMKKFNLSEWALDHRSFVAYLMIVFLVAGVYSYLKLGRDEDPPFVFNAMLINVQWPGATTDEMMNVVTDRIEKKLQEIPSLDYVKSETKAGDSTITVALKESTPASEIPNVWYVVRKKIGDISATLPQ